jgi:hypothetical protein
MSERKVAPLAHYERRYRAWCANCKAHLEAVAPARNPPSHVRCPGCARDCEVLCSGNVPLRGSLDGQPVGYAGK